MAHVEEQEAAWPWLFPDGSRAPDEATAKAAADAAQAADATPSAADVALARAGPAPKDLTSELSALERKESHNMRDMLRRVAKKPAYQDMQNQRRRLPAYKVGDKIVKLVADNQVVVVSGATGSGKTTQLPQLILDDLINRLQGARANIICTQPRRISAIGVADRVAAERAEAVGATVGYQIRLESARSSKTRLLFCTSGVLLRRMQCDPWLRGVSHVILDEVHERDLNTDFLLIVLRRLLRRRPDLKAVLMSATLNADLFADYFDGCPVLEIEGRAHPVTAYFLEDAVEHSGYVCTVDSEFSKASTQGRRQVVVHHW